MFNYKYKIEFKNQEIINLFGEDFFGDKSTFWNVHQTDLKHLYNSVLTTDFPFKIIDLEHEIEISIQNQVEFNTWIETTQPFKIP